MTGDGRFGDDGSIAALARGVARGDDSALDALYRRKVGLVLGWCEKATGRDESFALDVVQETFVRVIGARRSLGTIDGESDLDRWLIAVAKSAAMDLLRRELRRRKREYRVGMEGEGAREMSGGDRERAEEAQRALTRISEDDGAMVRMKVGGGTFGQIARAFGISTGSAQGRVRRAVRSMGKTDGEPDHE